MVWPFLEYLLDCWIGQGICEFILSVYYLKDSIIEHFGREYHSAKITYISEEKPLDTGGGLLFAIKNISSKQSFLVLNGDTFFVVPLSDLTDFHRKNSSALTFSLFRTTETKRYLSVGYFIRM
jgi:D-glycero-alpha-D-manno-heptose 1-phosphate guanylyltransferase